MKKVSTLLMAIMILGIFSTASATTITTGTLIYNTGTDKHLIYNDLTNDGLINSPFAGTDIYTESQLLYGNGTSTLAIFWIQGRQAGEQVFLNYSYVWNGILYDSDLYYGSHWTNYTSYIETYSGKEFLWLDTSHLSPTGITRQDFSWSNGQNTATVSMYLEGTKPINNPVPEPATMFLFGLGLLGFAKVNRKK